MGTIADKLAKLNATKADLKAALAEKGQTVGEVFSAYPAAVRAIETGGELVTEQLQKVNPAELPNILTEKDLNFLLDQAQLRY